MALTHSAIRADELSTCISCGLCLNACPTFRLLGDEADSPRGRIALMRGLVASYAAPDRSTVEHLEACLVCRACETACPSGVPFGRLMEGAREIVAERDGRRPLALRAGLATLARPRLLAWVVRLARLYRRSGARTLARRLRLVPRRLRDAEALLPDRLDAPFAPRDAAAAGVERHHVAFLVGCVMGAAFGEVDRATVRLLQRGGCRVSVPAAQTCCGALHAHAGDAVAARALAKRELAAFEASGAEAVIVNAAGCGAHLKAYGQLLRDDPAWSDRAARFASAVRDASEFLAAALADAPPPIPATRVAYQDACHLAHGQGVRAQPRALLRAIPGVTLVELGDAETCCGSAGIYNLTHPRVADELGRAKARAVVASGADVVVTANPGCLMQLQAQLRAVKSPIRVAHLMTFLDEAYMRK